MISVEAASGGRKEGMKKKKLKWYLIQRFLIIMLAIYVCGELISILYRGVVFPFLGTVLDYQQVQITGKGNIFVFIIQMLLYFVADLLPHGLSEWIQRGLALEMGEALQIGINSPLYGGRWGILLRILLIAVFLFLLGFSLLPYVAGALWYYRVVTVKVNELLEEEKEHQLIYERKRNLLLSDIAHDIKTPITTICGYSKALAEGVVKEDKRQAYLDAIYTKSMRMDELVTLLFEYVKLGSEGYELNRQQGNLAELMRESVALLYADFEEKGMELVVEIPEEPVFCEMDRLQMGRAIGNLLTNALRYGKEGGKVMVRLQEDVITVADDGEPIDPEFAEHIFEPFARGDKARTTKGGTGLGLGIASQIVKMHGGRLELDCHAEEGYTKAFRIYMHEK